MAPGRQGPLRVTGMLCLSQPAQCQAQRGCLLSACGQMQTRLPCPLIQPPLMSSRLSCRLLVWTAPGPLRLLGSAGPNQHPSERGPWGTPASGAVEALPGDQASEAPGGAGRTPGPSMPGVRPRPLPLQPGTPAAGWRPGLRACLGAPSGGGAPAATLRPPCDRALLGGATRATSPWCLLSSMLLDPHAGQA